MVMTASSGEQNTKRPNGFSIDSIIGKQSEKSDNVKNSSNNNRKDSDIFVSSQSSPERHEGFRTTSSTKDKKELSYGIHHHNNSVSSSSRDTSNISPLSPTSRNRDDFSSAIHPSARDSLKDLHEVLAQTAGATGTYMSPRLCRHPLSALNLHSIYPSHLQQASPIHPLVLNSTRDIRHLHPWLSERYPSHYYYPRYPVGAAPGFLFQPYRKPKRIRTAFSPSQLLQLEKAFEKSHYVVGQERKDLAAELQLTETQVKVWFQNRRTKHKRMKAEEEGGISSPGSHGNMALSKLNMSDSDSEISDINDDEDDGHMICVSNNGLS